MEKDKMKVLLIDDDEMILKSLAPVFVADGFEVIVANNGDTGLIEALNKEPNVIITDIEMKDVNGMVVLEEIRKSGKWGEKVPVILLTNFDTSDKILKGIVQDHPYLYLLKSEVDPKKVLEKAKESLGLNHSK